MKGGGRSILVTGQTGQTEIINQNSNEIISTYNASLKHEVPFILRLQVEDLKSLYTLGSSGLTMIKKCFYQYTDLMS